MNGNPWVETEIGDQLTLQRGFDITKAQQRVGRVPVVSSSGIKSNHDTPRAEGPGVLLGRKGRVGTVYYVKESYWPHDTTLWVKDFKGNHPRFVYYFFKSISAILVRLDHGTANPTLNRNHIHPLVVKWPTRTEQERIASLLGALDDKIELTRAINSTLEALIQAIFRSWFVDFDPVVAKVDGRQPFGMSEEMASLFPDRFVDSEIGLIPEKWEAKTVPELFEINPSCELQKGILAPYLAMQNAPTTVPIPEVVEARTYGSGVKFQNGDTLLAKITPCLENGKTVYVQFLENDQVGWGSTEFIVLRSSSGIPPEFSYFFARDDAFRNHAIANMTGSSGRQRVPLSSLDHYRFPLAPPLVLQAFGRVAASAMAKMQANVEESRTLAELRDLLLPKLLSGEIRLAEAEEAIEAVGA